MPRELAQKAVKEIWDSTSIPAPDGNRYLIFKGRDDLVYLYCCGFVDETQFSVDDWVDSFADSQMPTGAYMVGESQWMSKARFRYVGPVGKPFDPYTMREGEWSDDEMQKLIRDQILSSVCFTAEEFREIFEKGKSGYSKNGGYRVDQKFKGDLLYLINRWPSPRRVREMRLDEAWAREMQKGAPASRTAAGTRQGYTTGKTPSEMAAERLTEIVSTGKKK